MSRTRVSLPATDPDLSARARRGSLSETEQAELERALEASRTLTTAHRVGLDFDRAFQVESGDEKLIAAMADAALGARPRRALPLRRWSMFGLVAALAIAGSAAAFNAVKLLRRAPAPAQVAPPNAVVAGSSAASQTASARAVAIAAPVAAETSAPPLVGLAARSTLVTPSAQPREDAPRVTSDAAALFGQAAAARRASDFGRSRSLYLQLEREFPSSSEAHLARVSLGKVLLVMGRAQEAERQFALYLGTGGSLSEEALVGRAQSLARLGRGTEEQGVWQTLLNQYPGSVYASAARARLSVSSAERP